MASSSGPSKYELFELTKGDKKIPLEGKITSFDYYESLLAPNINATITMVDTGNSVKYDKKYDTQERLGTIYNALPLTGDGSEEIRFKITSKLGTLDFSNIPLYVNGSVSPDQESNKESIVLSLVSKSAINNRETTVKKNYYGAKSNNSSVKLICENILKIPSNKLEIDNTSNNYPFIGNGKAPFETILMLCSKSTPEKGNPGFFFYETQDGHKFKSIDNLIEQKEVEKYYKSDVNKSSINVDTDYKILSFSITKNQNLINALKSGVYCSRTIVFNPKTFQEEEIEFRLGTLESSLGKKEPPKPENQVYTRTFYSVKDVGALSPSVKDGSSSGKPEEWQGKVQMRYNLLFTQVAHIQVPVNPNLKAGDIIQCDFQINTLSEVVQGSEEPVQGGKYLIMDLCHHYDTEKSHTSMTLVRDTYGKYTNI